jgi:outer membrane receptor for ferric coprogen and ferric-rhodotorulic acid
VPNPGYTKERANFFTRYTFSSGPLRGFYVGGGLNFRLRTFRGNADLDGIAATPPTELWSPAYTLYTALAGYSTRVFKRPTSFALNVSNLFDKDYYRSSGIANGSWGDPRSIRLTVTTDL